jgi:hypothetical protein
VGPSFRQSGGGLSRHPLGVNRPGADRQNRPAVGGRRCQVGVVARSFREASEGQNRQVGVAGRCRLAAAHLCHLDVLVRCRLGARGMIRMVCWGL